MAKKYTATVHGTEVLVSQDDVNLARLAAVDYRAGGPTGYRAGGRTAVCSFVERFRGRIAGIDTAQGNWLYMAIAQVAGERDGGVQLKTID